eukprot:2131934-Rhodomonas_salina.2
MHMHAHAEPSSPANARREAQWHRFAMKTQHEQPTDNTLVHLNFFDDFLGVFLRFLGSDFLAPG